MQGLGAVTTENLLQRGQEPLLKLEAFIRGSWVNLCNLHSAVDLVGYWPFDEGAGMVAYDKSKEENNGSLENMEEGDWVDGKVGKALDFDGANERVTCGNPVVLQMGASDFSISVWVKFHSLVDSVALVTKGLMRSGAPYDDDGWALSFYTVDDKVYFDTYKAGQRSSLSSIKTDWVIDTWYHIVIVRDGTVAKIYVDGDLDNTGTAVDVIEDTVYDVAIGADKGGLFNHFDGLIDEVRIYKRTLTVAEIKALYELKGKNYLESISLSHAGAGMSPNPIAATLSAEINNEGAIFHPKHPTSAYTDYFKAGRKVRISVGAKYGGTDYYWPRIIGYIDAPKISGKTFKVSISGLDYTKTLADTLFKKTAVPPDNYWGDVETFDSVASWVKGTELYDPPGGDAAEIGAGEADNVGNWALETNGATAISSEDDVGGFSDYEIKFIANPGDSISAVKYAGVCDVVAETEYNVTFKYARISGDDTFRLNLRDAGVTVGGSGLLDPAVNGDWYSGSFSFTPESGATLDMYLTSRIVGAPSIFRVDQISIIDVVSQPPPHRYQLPEACNGVHYVELDYYDDGNWQPVWPGRQKDGEEGWFYDPDLKQLYFAEGKIVDAGTANLKVYYYTDQAPENVVADLMVKAGLYADQAAALLAMEEAATGFTIPQVWFDAGKSCLSAIKMLCERCDYRFYFKYNGTPVFKPVPSPKAAGSEDLTFRRWHLSEPEYYEDRNEIRNRVVIEGLKQALPEGAEETVPSELKGTAADDAPGASIDTYGEHTLSIRNHLFQDQDSLDAMCATLLARYKDPMWYFDSDTPFNPAPLEIWDTIVAELLLKPSDIPGSKYGSFKYDSGVKYGSDELAIWVRGLIRDIKIDKYNITYKSEEVT